MNSYSKVLYFLTIFVYIVLTVGDCPPEPSLQKDFDLNQYLGKWFEIQSYPSPFQKGLTCVEALYEINKTTNEVSVVNSGYNAASNEHFTSIGRAKQDVNNPANISVDFSGNGTFEGQYWVVKTDYTNSSLVYSCRAINGTAAEYAWILSRDKTLDAEVVTNLTKVLSDFGSDTKLFHVTDQSKCSGAAHTTLSSLSLFAVIYFILKITVS